MKDKLLGIAGILTPLFYVIGFVSLFILNPKTFSELNNISLAAYNIIGIDYRWTSVAAYSIVGVLNLVFCTLLFRTTENKSLSLAGKIFLLISGLLWLSFGIFPNDPADENSTHMLIIRVLALLVTTCLAYLFLGAEFEIIAKDKFLKWYTLSSGLIILLLILLSTFVFNDETWIRTNISITIYFIWFGVFGLRTLQNTICL